MSALDRLMYVVFFEGCSPGALVSPEGGSMMIQDGDGTSFMAEAIYICVFKIFILSIFEWPL